MFFDLNDNRLSIAYIRLYYCFFFSSFNRVLIAFLTLLNRVSIFALIRFNSFQTQIPRKKSSLVFKRFLVCFKNKGFDRC